jgi:hypothetical protein
VLMTYGGRVARPGWKKVEEEFREACHACFSTF